MRHSFDTYMDNEGLNGISFSPKPKSISSSERKGTWKTDTGISIIWDGERSDDELHKEIQEDGSIIITIKANDVTEKD